jgi:sugar (pentulose or hexulose) kinase
MYFIGVDNGSTRTRTVVWNLESASLAAQLEQSYGLVPGLPQGLLEQDPSLWDHAVDPTVRDCLAQVGGQGSARHRSSGKEQGCRGL